MIEFTHSDSPPTIFEVFGVVYNEDKMREISTLPTQILKYSIQTLFTYFQSLQRIY